MIKIAFVRKNPQIRIYKQALALKKTGKYKLILIARRYDKNLFGDVFDEIISFEPNFKFVPELGFNFSGKNITLRKILNRVLNLDEKKLAKIVRKTNTDLFHAVAEPNIVPRIVIENAKSPVVFDAYDFSGISSGIENLSEKERISERYCLEHADGICHKGPPFEIDYYRQYGYKINCPELQWMDYCDEDLFADINTKKLSEEDGEVHLVHTGNISTDPKYRYCYFIPLGKQLAKQKIHFHIYPNPYQYTTSKEYIELNKKERYFHFHTPVPYKELSKMIAKYDWGLWIHLFCEGRRANLAKWKVALGNKLFSYLEAGLPIVVSDHLEYGKEPVEKYNVGFSVKDEDLPDLKEIIESYNYKELQKNVLRAREELLLRNQAHRLEKFYEKVINGK